VATIRSGKAARVPASTESVFLLAVILIQEVKYKVFGSPLGGEVKVIELPELHGRQWLLPHGTFSHQHLLSDSVSRQFGHRLRRARTDIWSFSENFIRQ
jgi:hypothetical protein